MFDENLAEPLAVFKETLGTLVGKKCLGLFTWVPFLNEVTQFWTFFEPPPPSVMPLCPRSYAQTSYFAPYLCDVIYKWFPSIALDMNF